MMLSPDISFLPGRPIRARRLSGDTHEVSCQMGGNLVSCYLTYISGRQEGNVFVGPAWKVTSTAPLVEVAPGEWQPWGITLP